MAQQELEVSAPRARDLAMKALMGVLVEVVNLPSGAKRLDAASMQETEELLDVSGEKGCCVQWLEDRQSYAVKTFTGLLVSVPEIHLQEWSPPPAEQGGFDAAWPIIDQGQPGQATVRFGETVTQALAEKGYCFIQTYTSQEEKEAMWESAQEQDREFFRMKQEVETGYMGFDSNNKVAWLSDNREVESNPDGLRYPDDETIDNSAFEDIQRQTNELASTLGMFVGALGISYSFLMNPLLRMSMTKNEEEDYLPESVRDMMQDSADQTWTIPIQEYLYFSKRRRLCAIHMIENSGGVIWFYPKEGAMLGNCMPGMQVPATPNKLLIFRHDIVDYSYQAAGPSLALQTWFMQDIGKSQAIKEMYVNLGELGDVGEVVCNPGPAVPDGPKASIMALTTRLPGDAWSPAQYWAMFSAGTDTITQWPYSRWETEPYYEEGADSVATGKSYTCHGGFTSQDQITQFDNVFFNIDETEARSMIPGQKMSLEVGYECLVASGLNAKSLKGRPMGIWFGDVGPDWHSFQTEWARFCPDISPTTLGTSMSCAVTAARIAHVFDIKGPVSSYDTACSASLVAMNAAHLCMFDQEPPRSENAEALIVGINTLLGPASFIGNCMATMLSHQGRSFTFNRSADGYQRGEGCGAVFVKLYQGDKGDDELRVCGLIGTATNQDGRSASLTAPNGPAQQQVIKKSMRFAGINPNTVSIAECHGTGTALGDPIEVGALMAVMHERKVPIFKTSAKSNIAHLEAGAGIAGLTKCIMMINMGTAPPNCHFNIINPHLTTEGYPVYFDSEDIDIGMASLYCGVSSFGFGGTNSRADVYGYTSKGQRPVLKAALPAPSLPKAMHIGQPLYISGSWDNFATKQPMEGGRYGTYTAAVALGESRWEEFQLHCSQDKLEVIHPLVKKADTTAQIVGPDYSGAGLNFLIDGRKDGVPPGTIYQIEFNWADEGKTISWFPLESETELAVIQNETEHKFYLNGSWRKFEKLQPMKQVGDGLYEGTFTIGFRNFEEFQIVRDKDYEQVIYPAANQTTRMGVPVCGPDWKGKGKCWRVKGMMHQEVTVKLELVSGKPTITVVAPSIGERTWDPWETWSRGSSNLFYACGQYGSVAMEPDTNRPGVHRCEVPLDGDGYAMLRILQDSDEQLALYPDHAGYLQGPSSDNKNQAWHIQGSRYAKYEVTLDMTVSDRSKMVTWRAISEQAALES